MTGRHAHLLRAALCATDIAAAVVTAAAAYALRFHLLATWFPVHGRVDVLPARYLQALPAAVLLLLLATAAAGLYESARMARRPAANDVMRLAGFSVAVLSTVALLYWREFQFSRAALLVAAPLYAVVCAGFRAVVLRRAARVSRPAPTLLVGGGAPARALHRALAAAPWQTIKIAAVVVVGPDETPADVPRIARVEDAVAAVGRGEFREVLVAVPASHAAEVPALLAQFEQTMADVRYVPDLGDAVLVNPSAAVVAGLPILALRERPLYGTRAAAKRALDVAIAAPLLVVAAPVLACVALLVRATSRGPALFVQERMGLDGRAFRMFKFRTMRADAEAATGPVFTRPGDPRITVAGRVLRRFSVDELPQLWNVLRGDMSLVGPRPERAPFIEEFRRRLPGYMLRHTVKAGMTGWAQVHGFRGDSSLETRLRYDLEYVDRWSLSLDLEILGRTAFQVLAGRNAY